MIYLTSKQGYRAVTDDQFTYLKLRSWHVHKSKVKDKIYFCSNVDTGTRDGHITSRYPQGRKVWRCTPVSHLVLGVPTLGKEVDHIDGNTLNNRLNNLRFTTRSENTWNKAVKFTAKSGYKGVVWQKHHPNSDAGSYRAYICPKGKQIRLGSFTTPEGAAEAYNKAAMKYYGKFAKLNKLFQRP